MYTAWHVFARRSSVKTSSIGYGHAPSPGVVFLIFQAFASRLLGRSGRDPEKVRRFAP